MYRYSASTNQFTFRTSDPMTNDQIARHAPSVMAEAARPNMTDSYAFIPTIDVIDGLRKEGFMPYEVRQTKTRDQSRRAFTKHMVRLRHHTALQQSDDEVGEIVLLNSHDGTSSYQLLAGFFRFVCSNGLIAGDVFSDVRVRHSGNVIADVVDASHKVLTNLSMASHRIDTFKSITLDLSEQLDMARQAIALRWGDDAPVTPSRMLSVRRWEDREPNLWNTFNSIQENVLKGGLPGRGTTGRRTTTRQVSGVSENVKLNQGLWTIADTMARIKQGEEVTI